MSQKRSFQQVGTRPIRHDGIDKVTGRANFGADFSLPGMLWGRVLRSPHAHAKILSIDTTKAEASEGVKAVISGVDFPAISPSSSDGQTDFRDLSRNVMAREKVLYHGHPIAAVAATSKQLADEALEKIIVEYELLKPVLSLDEALAPGATILHDDLKTRGADPPSEEPTNVASRIELGRGDPEAAFATADVIVDREFTTQMVHQGYIEPHAVVARTNEDGQSLIWCTTQGPFMIRAYCARLLGLDASKIRVTPSEIGGGFGGKTTVYVEPLAVLLSQRSGRPVKMVMTREEVFRATGPASGTRIRVKLGAKNDGTLVAGTAEMYYEAGAFKGSAVAAGAMCLFASYDLQDFRIEGYDVVLNKPKVAAYRAPGGPMAVFASESVMDELAEKLEIDPIDFRLHNAAREGVQATYGPKFNVIGLIETLEAAREHPHYKAPLGPNQGRGLGCGFWFNAGMQSTASVSLNEDGTAVVVSGCPDIGGSRTSLALMAAEELGIPVERVRPVVGDTETVGVNDGTGGSRVTFATGMAVIEAAQKVVQELRERAAAIWGVEVDQVGWQEGRAQPKDGGEHEPLDIETIARRAGRTGGPITASSSLTARGAGPSFATHICDVEVDPETGFVRVVRYTAIQDAGKAIHPGYVEGQFQGGAAQGIGWALNEAFVFDDEGKLENPGFLDYRIPVASDLPMIDTLIIEVPNPRHPYGVRGVGETPIVAPLAAVANALHNATGARLRDLPMSPPRVLDAIDSVR
ncbi:MAG: xanthine dehydrogenase family protein molybdopterin-binding subunit [bacterium]|nr:xanthine dehydrogenase family protein molybdopterin-binding subunit [bacterium]